MICSFWCSLPLEFHYTVLCFYYVLLDFCLVWLVMFCVWFRCWLYNVLHRLVNIALWYWLLYAFIAPIIKSRMGFVCSKFNIRNLLVSVQFNRSASAFPEWLFGVHKCKVMFSESNSCLMCTFLNSLSATIASGFLWLKYILSFSMSWVWFLFSKGYAVECFVNLSMKTIKGCFVNICVNVDYLVFLIRYCCKCELILYGVSVIFCTVADVAIIGDFIDDTS